jgi:hypothetical protein
VELRKEVFPTMVIGSISEMPDSAVAPIEQHLGVLAGRQGGIGQQVRLASQFLDARDADYAKLSRLTWLSGLTRRFGSDHHYKAQKIFTVSSRVTNSCSSALATSRTKHISLDTTSKRTKHLDQC